MLIHPTFTALCVLSASSSIFNSPQPITLSINFVLSISSIPSIIYVGQNFTATVGCTGTPSLSTIGVDLNCGGASVYTWNSVNLNQETIFNVPSNLATAGSCTLVTVLSSYYVQATSSSFSLEDVQLTFTKPTSQTFSPTDSIPILITASPSVGAGTSITANLACPGSSLIRPFQV